jgi:hypothetical protein
MAGQLLTLPLRLWARGARVALHAAEDVTELALTSTLRVAGALANLRPRGPEPVAATGVATPTTPPSSTSEPRRSARPSSEARRSARPRPSERTPSRSGAARTRNQSRAVTPDPRSEVTPSPRVEEPEPRPSPIADNGQLASERLEQEGATVAVDLDAPTTEVAHVSEEPTLAREEAEPGAEDGAGASITVRAPWEGYEGLSAKVVIARLSDASPEELATIQLFEGTHRKRRTIIEAVERELRTRPRTR